MDDHNWLVDQLVMAIGEDDAGGITEGGAVESICSYAEYIGMDNEDILLALEDAMDDLGIKYESSS